MEETSQQLIRQSIKQLEETKLDIIKKRQSLRKVDEMFAREEEKLDQKLEGINRALQMDIKDRRKVHKLMKEIHSIHIDKNNKKEEKQILLDYINKKLESIFKKYDKKEIQLFDIVSISFIDNKINKRCLE
jgi:inorganic triphosphatase YgiF